MQPTFREFRARADRRSRVAMILVGTFLSSVFVVAFVYAFTH
jgi:hypothetical protein